MLPTIVFLVVYLMPISAAPIGGRTAVAIIYEEDGVWGSVVFRQRSKNQPVLVETSFKNVMKDDVSFEIRSKGVPYDDYPREKLCSEEALKGVMIRMKSEKMVNGGDIELGRVVRKNVYEGMSLFDGESSIIGRSFVLRQGGLGVGCGTIVQVGRDDIQSGLIPCVKKSYERCLVGTENAEVCVYRKCEGHERFWGAVERNTVFCRVVKEVYPKLTGGLVGGGVGCHHGRHGLLMPTQG